MRRVVILSRAATATAVATAIHARDRASAAASPQQEVHASLNYTSVAPSSVVWAHATDSTKDLPLVATAVRIADGRERQLSLASHGFELRHDPIPTPLDFYDAAAVRKSYYGAVERLVLEAVGEEAVSVHAIEHNVRNSSRAGCHAPAGMVHGDFTGRSAPRRLYDLAAPFRLASAMSAALRGHPRLDAETVARALNPSRGGRFAIVNVWRPISSTPVHADPLACCDTSTVDMDTDVALLRLHDSKYTENLLGVLPAAERHAWYYFPQMSRDEAIVLRVWDSAGGGPCLHSSFRDPTAPEDAPCRESIEVRCIVLFEPRSPPPGSPPPPSPPPPLPLPHVEAAALVGLWRGQYPGHHGKQMVRVELDGSSCLTATKLSGDNYVPCGEVTFSVSLPSATLQTLSGGDGDSQSCVRSAIDSGTEGLPIYQGCGTVAEKGFGKPRSVPGQLLVLSEDRMAFWWVMQRECVVFERVNEGAEDIIQEV